MSGFVLSEWILVAIQAATLVALIVYVAKTWEMAAATRDAANASAATLLETRETRLAEMAPRVMVYLDPAMTYRANIVIENAGKGTAKNVSFSWDPPLRVIDQPNNYDPMQFFETPKAMLPPGFRVRHLLDAWPNLFLADLPERYEVTVQYEGVETQREYSVTHVLDIAAMKHRTDAYEKDMGDLVDVLGKELQDLDRKLDSIGKNLGDLSRGRSYAAAIASDAKTSVGRLLAYWELYQNARALEEAYVPWKLYLHELRRYAMAAYFSVRAENAPEEVSEAIREIIVHSFGLRIEHPAIGDNSSAGFDRLFDVLKRAAGSSNTLSS